MAPRRPTRLLAAPLAVFLLLGSGAVHEAAAHGTCSVLGFEVNDYGKEGPKADAKRLLDDHIVKWAKKHGITNYHRSGKKTVSCRLYIDVGFFDEWTCTARQKVCYFGRKRTD
ncbi:MAG: hypothetical protein AAFQ42_08825 [Pseudomonadota bacterium]